MMCIGAPRKRFMARPDRMPDRMDDMQVLQAGEHKLLLLELDPEFVANIAKQAGFEHKLAETPRSINLELTAAERQAQQLQQPAEDRGGTQHRAGKAFEAGARRD